MNADPIRDTGYHVINKTVNFFCAISFFTLPHERLENSFIHRKIFSSADLSQEAELIISQLFGFYSALNGVSGRQCFVSRSDFRIRIRNTNIDPSTGIGTYKTFKKI